jgi:N-methylhydantoinase A
MGGTTFDVSVIRDGLPLERDMSVFQRYELALPMLDVESIGAGGGSIAWIDASGRLNVGPQSAGADAGAGGCYGRGVAGDGHGCGRRAGRARSEDASSAAACSSIAERALDAVRRDGRAASGLDPYEAAAGIARIVDCAHGRSDPAHERAARLRSA